MTKVIIITCDICGADITSASKIELHWKDNYTTTLNESKHFCGFAHFMQFVEQRKSAISHE